MLASQPLASCHELIFHQSDVSGRTSKGEETQSEKDQGDFAEWPFFLMGSAHNLRVRLTTTETWKV